MVLCFWFVVVIESASGDALNHLFGIGQRRQLLLASSANCRVAVARKKTYNRRPIHPSQVAAGESPFACGSTARLHGWGRGRLTVVVADRSSSLDQFINLCRQQAAPVSSWV